MANSEAMAERLAAEIRSQESLHSSLLKDLAKVAARNLIDNSIAPKKATPLLMSIFDIYNATE